MKHFSVEVVHTVYPLQKFFVSFVGAPEKVGWEVVEVVEKGELSALKRREGGDVSRSSRSRDAAVHRIQRGAGYASMSGVAKNSCVSVESERQSRISQPNRGQKFFSFFSKQVFYMFQDYEISFSEIKISDLC